MSPAINKSYSIAPKQSNRLTKKTEFEQDSSTIIVFRAYFNKIGTPKWLCPVAQSVWSTIDDTMVVSLIPTPYFRGD